MRTSVHASTQTRQVSHRCPWCGDMSDSDEGVCSRCVRRTYLSTMAAGSEQVLIPAGELDNYPSRNIPSWLRILYWMEQEGAITGWMRPNISMYARDLGISPHSASHAVHLLVQMGILERRKAGRKLHNSPSDYRLVVQPA